MSSIKRKSRTVLLPKIGPAESGDIVLNTPNNCLYLMKGRNTFSNYDTITVEKSTFEEWDRCMIAHHVYVTSAEIVDENFVGWTIATDKLDGKDKLIYCAVVGEILNHHDIRQIIATTDNNIKLSVEGVDTNYPSRSYPKPSPQFILKYIKEYNAKNVISDVYVDYIIDENKRMAARIAMNSKYGAFGSIDATGIQLEELNHIANNATKLKVDKDGFITISKCENPKTLKEICSANPSIRMEIVNLCTTAFQFYTSDDSLNDGELREKFENWLKTKI